LSDLTNTGVFVVEGLSRDQAIPVHRKSVTAFVGPAPRGPVNRPIQINGYDQYRRIYAAPGCQSRLEHLIRQFFANGGESVWVVRVTGSTRCNYIELPGPAGSLVLKALNPGPLECLRASVDYDGVSAHDPDCFNLVVQRLRSASEPLVEEQEIYRMVSLDKGHERFIGHALLQSTLVQQPLTLPEQRPDATVSGDAVKVVGYQDCVIDWPSSSVPDDYDIIGSESTSTGLFALNALPDLDLLCLLPGSEDTELGPVATLAAERYCQARQALLVVDPPSHWKTATDVMRDHGEGRFHTSNMMTYFPLLRTRSETGERIIVSAMGAIAGALVAGSGPVQDGREKLGHDNKSVMIRGRYQPAIDLTEDQSSFLARMGINTLMPATRLQMKFCGNVTSAVDGGLTGHWKTLTTRREGLFVVGSIRKSTTWVAGEESSPELWAEIAQQVREFLSELRKEGRLAGELDEEAFYVRCDATTNADTAGRTGELTLLAGFALDKPNEFSEFRFQRHGDECQIVELSGVPRLHSGH